MELAVTVLGRDRTGIIADVAGALAALGANLTDSTMTRLRGHFAMTLICSVEASAAQVEAALAFLAADGQLLVGVREIGADEEAGSGGSPYVLSVHGADRLGIVAALTRVIAQAGGNITDLSTRLSGQLYLLIAELDLPTGKEAELQAELAKTAAELGVEVRLRPAETDVL
ncbi:glycine cleavage system protein R [Catelliglobosispora koreensis]|uniref:glycine cleavage system protein R n=1 Tax=Catelliglobosispora koreensis TaxID=129052 RepID=UPI000371CD11|nr:ACT domain-containing protein [Catelliglobosispora koreensis]